MSGTGHKPKVVVSRELPRDLLEPLRNVSEVTVWPEDRPAERSFLMAEMTDAAGLLCMLTDVVDAELLDVALVAQPEPGEGGGGYRVISNAGEAGVQDVPHLHVHILGGRRLGRMVQRAD